MSRIRESMGARGGDRRAVSRFGVVFVLVIGWVGLMAPGALADDVACAQLSGEVFDVGVLLDDFSFDSLCEDDFSVSENEATATFAASDGSQVTAAGGLQYTAVFTPDQAGELRLTFGDAVGDLSTFVRNGPAGGGSAFTGDAINSMEIFFTVPDGATGSVFVSLAATTTGGECANVVQVDAQLETDTTQFETEVDIFDCATARNGSLSQSGLPPGNYNLELFISVEADGSFLVPGSEGRATGHFDATVTVGPSGPPPPPPPACDNPFSDQGDSIVGTAGDDRLCGGGGNDRIRGLGGNDTITGGAGIDVLIGDDFIGVGGVGGNDTIDGGDGDDRIQAGPGDDAIDGGNDVDDILGGTGNDRIIGGAGDDTIEDSIGPVGGNDIIDGGVGEDRIDGGSGNDVITGGGDDDRIDGLFGNDTIDGGDGSDNILGGDDADTIFGGSNLITDGDGNDIIDGGGGDDTIRGGAGNDDIFGGFDDGNDFLAGGNGNDLIDGGAGLDTINGEDGNDRLFAADGSEDGVDGGNGVDRAQADRAIDFVENVERLRRI